jgi:NAD(P)-dependent dehydrogenase (short-subunit alcohol dehydrogenase family)
MTAAYLDKQPHLLQKWSSLNPMGRIGRPDELRGVIAWLASDASSFCTGSEYVTCCLLCRSVVLTLALQHPR